MISEHLDHFKVAKLSEKLAVGTWFLKFGLKQCQNLCQGEKMDGNLTCLGLKIQFKEILIPYILNQGQ